MTSAFHVCFANHKVILPQSKGELQSSCSTVHAYIYILGKSIMLFAFFQSNSGLLDHDLVKHYNYTADNTTLLVAVKTKANLSVVK